MSRLPQPHRLLPLVALPTLVAAGFAAAAAPRSAGADPLPLPTVSLPGLPTTIVTLPTLPELTTSTTTTTTTITTTVPDPASTTAAAPPTSAPQAPSSGTAPVVERLVIDRLWIAPTVVRLRRSFVVGARVKSGRGDLMRGVLVSLAANPRGSVTGVRARATGPAGIVRFTLRPAKRSALRASRLVIVVSARSGRLAAKRTISVRVKG